MLPVSRQPVISRRPVARIFLASLLALALLAGILPLSALSWSHACEMACCAGKSPHEAGSCRVAFAAESEEEALPKQAAADSHGHTQHAAHHNLEESATSSHHESAEDQQPHHSSSGGERQRVASIASLVVTKPCSPECAAAAAAATAQLRRPRQHAAQTFNAQPRPPAQKLCVRQRPEPLSESAATRRLSRPRAPPILLINFPA